MDRRTFVKNSTIATVAATTFPAALSQNVMGANDRLNVAIIGCGRMGRQHRSPLPGRRAAEGGEAEVPDARGVALDQPGTLQ